MKKIIFTLMLSIFLFLGVNAEYRVYDNVEDFENAKGSICESATDGCNTFFMTDGKVMGGTRMYCADTKVEWTCKKFKENSISTMSLTTITTSIETEEPRICTMEYAPVCAEAQIQCIKAPCYPIIQTFSNSCMAGKNEIIYTGECRVKKELLSKNDQNFYDTIKGRLDTKIQKIVDKAIIKYEKRLDKYSDSNKKILNDTIIVRVEKKISDLLMKYPVDIALPVKVNEKYLTYILLKFELMKIEF